MATFLTETLLPLGLLALFLVPALRDRRALRRAQAVRGLPALDTPPALSTPLPRPWARRRYVETGVAEVSAWLRTQSSAH
ncbi:hypothetical protein ACFFKU_10050 [Kineococcus gynurae]|uniref:Uncharacterized protein n=1 Tax=Kineococcus gynurae TaxID=452979 RepID=A0ABV5LV60_9ACTN